MRLIIYIFFHQKLPKRNKNSRKTNCSRFRSLHDARSSPAPQKVSRVSSQHAVPLHHAQVVRSLSVSHDAKFTPESAYLYRVRVRFVCCDVRLAFWCDSSAHFAHVLARFIQPAKILFQALSVSTCVAKLYKKHNRLCYSFGYSIPTHPKKFIIYLFVLVCSGLLFIMI